MSADGVTLLPGDVLQIERRYMVDGVLQTVTDEGRYAGVERVGTTEHLVLKGPKREVRLFPLTAISEIKLVKAGKRAKAAKEAPPGPPGRPPWDPSVG